ncbi:putative FBD-associated F-box protein At5g50270 [Triticum aestivum]|uniref:putative FBD-associated F-box protein At5g50270 n=1 Tax=Triticum aestivum TaxID=4565 RepID=UPI001D00323F|nr:putative FBD-associated F-box protein At5g50270 [Triticum aestivum]
MELRSGSRLRSSRHQQLGLPRGAAPDRISALPDDLLLLVLARLPCAAAAARTGVLSRRWRGLWAHLRQIVLHDTELGSIEPALGRVCPAVSLLKIHVPEPPEQVDADSVNSLLRAAARLEPEELFFHLSPYLFGPFPVVDLPCFRRATSIALHMFSAIRVPAGVEFPALETLCLSCCNDAFDSLLSSCPRLRTLKLDGIVLNETSLRVHSPSLLELVVDLRFTHSVSIVAPALKQLTVSFTTSKLCIISVSAPMVEKVSWNCCYYYGVHVVFGLWYLEQVTLQTAERQGQLPSLHIRASAGSTVVHDDADNFAHEVEKHMVATFSVLDLRLTTYGHAFGALVFHLLGMDRIRTAMRRLKVVLQRLVEEGCESDCPCEPTHWRSQTVSLTALEEVEINGFEGEDHEFDFLKLIVRCAPMLKRMILKLSWESSESNDVCTKISKFFRTFSSLDCCAHHSSGEVYVWHE